MLAIALIATILALIQNGAMFAFGVKEIAIASARAFALCEEAIVSTRL